MQLELPLDLPKIENQMIKLRGFNVVSKYASDSIIMPSRATKKSAGYDIYNQTGADIVLEPGELSKKITTKLSAYMQDDEVLLLYPRSGLGFTYSVRLANTVGVIDADYNQSANEGEIFVKLHNQGSERLVIPNGEAFAQGIFTKWLLIDGDDYNTGADRNGGLGSTTGKK